MGRGSRRRSVSTRRQRGQGSNRSSWMGKDERGCRARCIWFPAFLTSFFANPNKTRGRDSIDMKRVCRSNRPLPRDGSSPYSIGRVDGTLRRSIASATNSLEKYSQMATGPYRQQALKAVRRKGESALFREERRSESWLGRVRRGRSALWM